MKADRHPREAERLEALHSYEILDTDREKDFDDIVQLASAICEAPISVINLIDQGRQWFKAEVGLGIRETPLDTSICSHAILTSEFTEVTDTRLDPRFADNPLVTDEPRLLFYAGALLTTDQGLPLGTLCVLDHEPRDLTPLQRDALRVLARQVMAQLEMRRALRHATMLRKEVDHRVKNSLQSLTALARIRRKRLTSPEAIHELETMQIRLEAVSTLHELLYRADAGGNVDLAAYLRQIADFLQSSAPEGVKITLDATPIRVTSQQAVSVGTLVNEFVTNSFKHAFPGAAAGDVRITQTVEPDGMVHVSCADNGVGVRAKRSKAGTGIGLQIAEVCCMELQTRLTFDRSGPGFKASFAFKPLTRADLA